MRWIVDGWWVIREGLSGRAIVKMGLRRLARMRHGAAEAVRSSLTQEGGGRSRGIGTGNARGWAAVQSMVMEGICFGTECTSSRGTWAGYISAGKSQDTHLTTSEACTLQDHIVCLCPGPMPSNIMVPGSLSRRSEALKYLYPPSSSVSSSDEALAERQEIPRHTGLTSSPAAASRHDSVCPRYSILIHAL